MQEEKKKRRQSLARIYWQFAKKGMKFSKLSHGLVPANGRVNVRDKWPSKAFICHRKIDLHQQLS